MPTFITLNDITGSTPYDVYLCLSGGTPCYYIDTIESTELPFNFTVDSNIDPFITIEVNSHSGYGAVFSDKRNYYLKGTKDITEPYRPIDKLGPFVPITPVY